VAIDVAALIFAPAAIGFLTTLLLAAAWCRAVDREEQRVQVVESDSTTLNLYPTQGSVIR
jgi:hypothetical protein